MKNQEPLDLFRSIQSLVTQEAKRVAEELLEEDQYTVATTQGHTHNGSDSPTVNYSDLSNKFFVVACTVPGTSAATATNYGTFFTASDPCLVIGVTEVHQTAGSDAGNVTLQLEKLTGTTAPDSGTVLLGTSFNLKGTANTVQTGTLVVSSNPAIQVTTTYLGKGDRLCLKDAGVLTAVANVTVVVKLLLWP